VNGVDALDLDQTDRQTDNANAAMTSMARRRLRIRVGPCERGPRATVLERAGVPGRESDRAPANRSDESNSFTRSAG